MPAVYGIDLGTTFSSCARVDEPGAFDAMPVAVEHGQLFGLASEVLLTRKRGQIVAYVGEHAQIKHIELGPDKSVLITESKRAIGVERGDGRYRRWDLDGEEFDPIDIAALVLKKVRQVAERGLDEDLGPVVVTHPRDFGVTQKHATEQAAKAIGLDLIDTLDEPVAGLYALLEPGAERQAGSYLVFDLGGGTLDIAVVDIGEGAPRVVGGHGIPKLGGVDWTRAMEAQIVAAIEARHPAMAPIEPRLHPRAFVDIRRLAERWKKLNASDGKIHRKRMDLTLVAGDPLDVVVEVARRAWLTSSRSLVSRAMEAIDEALTQANRSLKDIVGVLPIGGSTRLASIQTALAKRFNGRVQPAADVGVNVDLAVALGAARYASYRFATDPTFAARRAKSTTHLRVLASDLMRMTLPHGLNILAENDERELILAPLVAQGADLPTSETRTFEVAGGGVGLEVEIYEGPPGPYDPSVHAKFTVGLPPDLEAREGDKVRVHVELSQSARIERVRVEHVPSGIHKEVSLKQPDRVDNERLDLEARRQRLNDIEVY